MWFKITDGGTDYVRVTMDVHNDQLRDVMRAVTEAAEPPAPARSVWDQLASGRDDRHAADARGNEVESEPVVRDAELRAERGEADGELVISTERLRIFGVDLLGGGRHHEGVLIADQADNCARRDDEPLHGAVPNIKRHRAWLSLADRVDDGVPDGTGPLVGKVSVPDEGLDLVDVKRDHDGLLAQCRGAGAARACGAGDTEATEPPLTKEERLLWAAQELGAMASALLGTGPEAYEDTEGVELGGPDCGDGAEGLEGGDA